MLPEKERRQPKKPKKKRKQITIPDKGLRYRLMAATGAVPHLHGQTANEAIAWLANYALAILFLDRVPFNYYLAERIYDENYSWAEADDPLKAMAEAALLEPRLVESVLLGRAKPTMEFLSAIAGVLEEDVDILLEMAELDNLGEEQVDVRISID